MNQTFLLDFIFKLLNHHEVRINIKNNMKLFSLPKRTFFIAWVLKYQVITFTIGFLFVHQLLTTLIIYFKDKEYFLKEYKLSIWIFILLIIVIYFFQWLIVSYTASRFTIQTLKDKFK